MYGLLMCVWLIFDYASAVMCVFMLLFNLLTTAFFGEIKMNI